MVYTVTGPQVNRIEVPAIQISIHLVAFLILDASTGVGDSSHFIVAHTTGPSCKDGNAVILILQISGLDRSSNLPKITEPLSGRAGLQPAPSERLDG